MLYGAIAKAPLEVEASLAQQMLAAPINIPVPSFTLPASAPASHHPDAQQETLQELVARTIASDITGTRSYLIAYTVVEDEQNLYRGTSASNDAIRQCWLYQAGSSQPCSSNDIEQAFSGQAQPAPWPRMRFALAYTQADKVLVLLDHFHNHDPMDRMDGYRYACCCFHHQRFENDN